MSDDEFRKAAGEHYKPLHDARSVVGDRAPKSDFDSLWEPVPDAALVIPAWGVGPGPVHLVTGSWYTGKTIFLMTIGLCVAAGARIFDTWSTRQSKWLHMDYEMGERGCRRYLQRAREGLGINKEDLRGNMDLCTLPKLDLVCSDSEAAFIELLGPYKYVTIDPLRSAVPGVDENKSEFREYIDLLSSVSDKTGATIHVLHHGGKPPQGGAIDRRNVGRGSSAIDDSVQTKFVLTANEEGGLISVTNEKNRELSGKFPPFSLQIVNTTTSVKLVHKCQEEVDEANEHTSRDTCIEQFRRLFAEFGGTVVGTAESIRGMIHGSGANRTKAWSYLITNKTIVKERMALEPNTYRWL